MSSCIFEFNDKYFVLCGVNLQITNNFLHFGICIINSYTNSVKISEFTDNDFLTTIENILIQNAPSHEDTNYLVLGNFPLLIYSKKFENLVDKLEMVDSKQLLVNSNEFTSNKQSNIYEMDSFSTIKLLLNDNDIQNTIFSKNELVFALNTLNGTINFTRMLQYSCYQNKFSLDKFNNQEYMSFDMTCVKSLNLFENLDDKKLILSSLISKLSKSSNESQGKISVYSILNTCSTKFGSRLLRMWILQPLQNIDDINIRNNIVELFLSSVYFKQEIKNSYLNKLYDIQTINMSISKYISNKNRKDKNENVYTLVKLENCAKLQSCINICSNLLTYIKCYEGIHSDLFFERYVNTLNEILKPLEKLEEMLSKTIVFNNKSREYVINHVLNADLSNIQMKIDECWSQIEEIRISTEDMVSQYKKQKVKVKITDYASKGLHLELTKTDGDNFLKSSRTDYKLVMSNKTSVIISNTKLSYLSQEIRELQGDYKEKEKLYYKKIVDVTSTYHPLFERLQYLLGEIDVLASFATVIHNSKETYCKPIINKDNNRNLILKDSRHLILEWNEDIIKKNNPNNKNLIPNDCILKSDSNIKLINGINMGGKSTYLRQVGICVLLAHIGMYIPASYAEVPIIDQIFTRVGAGDIMLKGISTFMNEMIEVCSLMKTATSNSLLLIDELGRGTSTDDGIAISFSILNSISKGLNCFCLFATHFYELTYLEEILDNVENYYVSYHMDKEELLMDYKITKGKDSNSYGVDLFRSLNFEDDIRETIEKILKL